MTWQFNWKVWHWPWHTKKADTDYMVYSHFAGFGPLQFHWYSTLDPAELA